MSQVPSDIGDALRLPATRCDGCDITWYPPRSRCGKCWSENLTEVYLPERGTIHSFTVVRIGRAGEPVPYGLAVADFANVRVFGRLANFAEARIGQEVVVERFSASSGEAGEEGSILSSGQNLYQFRPIPAKSVPGA